MAEPSKAADEMKPKTNINIWKYLALTRARTHALAAPHLPFMRASHFPRISGRFERTRTQTTAIPLGQAAHKRSTHPAA